MREDTDIKPDEPYDYWASLPLEELIIGYVLPHAGKAELDGAYVRQYVLLECARRLSLLGDKNDH